jgi:L-gulonolactone oxidase
MNDTVCVTGGSGGIGFALLKELVKHYRVKALFRTKTHTTDMWEQHGCIPVWGDLSQEKALRELVQDARYVFHCAALVTQATYAESYPVNVEGTRQLARTAANAGCGRFVHVSSAAVYGGAAIAGERDYTEDLELVERDSMAVYALTKLQAEQAVMEVSRESGLEYAIVRPTFVYGPYTKSYTLVPLALMRKGLPVMVGDGKGLLDAVYVDDVADALILAAGAPQAAGQAFNIGHEPLTFRDFYAHYARMLNRAPRSIPMSVLKTLNKIFSLFPRADGLRRGVTLLVGTAENTRLYPSLKAKSLLGYTPRVRLSIGMLKTEIWAKQERIVPPGDHSLDFYGPLSFRPVAIVHPADERELVQVMQVARESRVKVKAIGSLHSQCPLPETDGVCVLLDRYRDVLEVAGPLVTVQAGMKLRDLNTLLAQYNLALPALGAIAEQTVAGAISTATHGGSLHHGSLSDCVDRLTFVRADGSILEIGRADETFGAAVVSLGALGIISTVTFRCVPAFLLQSRSSVKKAPQVWEEFDEIHSKNAYVDMLYFPSTDDVEVLIVNPPAEGSIHTAEIPRTSGKPRGKPSGTLRRLRISGLMAIAWTMRRNHAIHRAVTRRAVGRSYPLRTGRSDLVLAFLDNPAAERSPGIIGDMEVAIRYSDACKALHLLRDFFAATGKFPLLPVHIRCSAASVAWMSPAYQRDVCWLEFCSCPRTDNLFAQVDALLAPFHYRSHWGKETAAGKQYLQLQYEKWNDFARLREAWDPDDMFLNSYLAPLFEERTEPRAAAH